MQAYWEPYAVDKVTGSVIKDVPPPGQAGGPDDTRPLGYWWKKTAPPRNPVTPTRRRPPRAARAARTFPLQAVGSKAVQFAFVAVFLILAVIAGVKIGAYNGSQPVKASAFFLVALVTFLLVRVDWPRYWLNLPSRIAKAGHESFLMMVIGGVFLAPSIIALSYGWQHKNDAIIIISCIPFIFGSGMAASAVVALVWGV